MRVRMNTAKDGPRPATLDKRDRIYQLESQKTYSTGLQAGADPFTEARITREVSAGKSLMNFSAWWLHSLVRR